jgi:hypothetical protein
MAGELVVVLLNIHEVTDDLYHRDCSYLHVSSNFFVISCCSKQLNASS